MELELAPMESNGPSASDQPESSALETLEAEHYKNRPA
jgi:hypothetical protein